MLIGADDRLLYGIKIKISGIILSGDVGLIYGVDDSLFPGADDG